MQIQIKPRHLKENGPKSVIKSALMEVLDVYSKQIEVYSSFCILKSYSGAVLATVSFPQQVKDFISNFSYKSTHKPFSFQLGEVYLCDGYINDILKNYLKQLAVSAGEEYYDPRFY